jgi:hypothetical protein
VRDTAAREDVMVARLPEIEVVLPVHEDGRPTVTWNGELVEADGVRFDEDGRIHVTIAGVDYDDTNAEISWRQETI